jgi:hypothetical protein
MKLGLFAINYGTCADPEVAVRVARHAEAAGFESVWTGEHIVLPGPQPRGFTMPPTLPFLDTVVALTLVATHTTTIRVATGCPTFSRHCRPSLDRSGWPGWPTGPGCGSARPPNRSAAAPKTGGY